VDGDGAPEILVATTASYAYAFRTDGTAVPGWPKHLSGSMLGFISFVLRDFDHDGVLEAILPCGNSLYVWRGDGSNYPGFPVNFASTYGPCATPAVGDLDGDGQLEIVLEGWEWLHVFHQDGSVAQGWPYRLSLSYEGFSYSSPVLVDADGDSYLEIVAAYHESGGGNWAGKVAVWRRDGTLMPGWPYVMADFGSWCYSTAAVADVDEDGALEFAMTSHNGRLYLFNFDGSQAPGFPIHTGYVNLEASCAIADLDDDSHLEICFGSNNPVYLGYERDGTVAPGFPTPMSAGMVVSGSCVADVDGDGRVNICAHEASGRVHLWDLPSPIRSDLLPWVRPHHDDHHTNLFSSVDPSALPDRFSSAFGSEGTLRLIPNPSHGDVRLLWTAGPGDLEWTIHDACGRRVGTGVLAASRSTGLHPGSAFSIDLDGLRGGPLPAGRYYVRAQGNGRILERSFILVR